MRQLQTGADAPAFRPDTVRPGRTVRVGGDLIATVTGNTIRQNAAGELYVSSLELCWWDGRTRHSEWVEPWQVTPVEADGVMGFVRG